MNRTRANTTTRILDALRRRIEGGEWEPGGRLPSEPILATELEASRGSLRGALAVLESQGFVVRRHGAGTFVNARRPLISSLHLNTGADEMITATGCVASTLQLSWQKLSASEEIRNKLGLGEGSEVFQLYRVRAADGIPVTVSYDYLSADIVPGHPALLGPSLYSFLSTVCGIDIAFGVASLTPICADGGTARSLNVDPGALCLMIKQVDYDASERPRSYSIEYHLASAFRFELLRNGPAQVLRNDDAVNLQKDTS